MAFSQAGGSSRSSFGIKIKDLPSEAMVISVGAAERVYGVKAVANELEVKLAGAARDDSDIATAIAHVLENNVQVPEGKVHAQVQNGWVTLDGEVDYDYQRREVERMVRQVRGVTGRERPDHPSSRPRVRRRSGK